MSNECCQINVVDVVVVVAVAGGGGGVVVAVVGVGIVACFRLESRCYDGGFVLCC